MRARRPAFRLSRLAVLLGLVAVTLIPVSPAGAVAPATLAAVLALRALERRQLCRRSARADREIAALAAEGIRQLERWMAAGQSPAATRPHRPGRCAGSCPERFRQARSPRRDHPTP